MVQVKDVFNQAIRSGSGSGDVPSALTNLTHTLRNSFSVVELKAISDADLIEAAEELEQVTRLIEYSQLKITAEIDARSKGGEELSLAQKNGCKNSSELLQRITMRPMRTISARIKLAQMIESSVALSGEVLPPRYSEVSQGLASGRLNLEIADQLVRDLTKLPPHIAVADLTVAESCLVAAAIGAPMPGDSRDEWRHPEHADSVRVMTSVWVQALDQDGKEPVDEQQILEQRFFNVGRLKDGLVPIGARVLPEVAALIGRIFDAFNSPRVEGKKPGVRFTALQTPEQDDGSEISDDRTGPQKRHDVFATILQRVAKLEDTPNLGGAPVTVLVETREESLATGAGIGLLHGHDGEMVAVSNSVITHAACSGAVQRVVTGSSGKLIALGSPERIFNSHQRKAITLRDGGCIIPGCNTPATWCEIHHVQEYAAGGKTHTNNGVTLCWYHHRSLETSGWKIEMRDAMPWVLAPKWVDHEQRWRQAKNTAKIPFRFLMRETYDTAVQKFDRQNE